MRTLALEDWSWTLLNQINAETHAKSSTRFQQITGEI